MTFAVYSAGMIETCYPLGSYRRQDGAYVGEPSDERWLPLTITTSIHETTLRRDHMIDPSNIGTTEKQQDSNCDHRKRRQNFESWG